uniref:Uncharacterized protein n=1 Tax=Pararge aegeria TaxID=116150 RepID=S4PSF4_9NEOP
MYFIESAGGGENPDLGRVGCARDTSPLTPAGGSLASDVQRAPVVAPHTTARCRSLVRAGRVDARRSGAGGSAANRTRPRGTDATLPPCRPRHAGFERPFLENHHNVGASVHTNSLTYESLIPYLKQWKTEL